MIKVIGASFNDVTFSFGDSRQIPRWLQDWGWSPGRPSLDQKVGTFSPTPKAQGERKKGLEMGLITKGQCCHPPRLRNGISVKTS